MNSIGGRPSLSLSGSCHVLQQSEGDTVIPLLQTRKVFCRCKNGFPVTKHSMGLPCRADQLGWWFGDQCKHIYSSPISRVWVVLLCTSVMFRHRTPRTALRVAQRAWIIEKVRGSIACRLGHGLRTAVRHGKEGWARCYSPLKNSGRVSGRECP